MTKAPSMGKVQVLQWNLDDHSHEPVREDFFASASSGHVNVLYGPRRMGCIGCRMNVTCVVVLQRMARPILDWILQHIPLGGLIYRNLSFGAGRGGNLLFSVGYRGHIPVTTVATREQSA